MLLTNTGITGSGNVSIQGRFMKILFTIMVTANSGAAALAKIATAKIGITKTHSSYGSEQVIYPIGLKDLLEIAACNDGAVTVETVNGTTQRITGTVEVSDTGAIEPMEREIYTISLTALATGVSVVMNSIDVPRNAFNQLQYKPLPTAANAPSPCNVRDSKWLCLPKAALTEIQLEDDNVKIVYRPEELDQITKELNPLSLVQDGSVTQGSMDLYCISVGWAKRALITTTSVVNVILVNDTQL